MLSYVMPFFPPRRADRDRRVPAADRGVGVEPVEHCGRRRPVKPLSSGCRQGGECGGVPGVGREGVSFLRVPRLRWVIRHPLRYLAMLGFGPVQLILLPTLVGAITLLVMTLRPHAS